MTEPTHASWRDDSSAARYLHSASDRGVAIERHARTVLVVLFPDHTLYREPQHAIDRRLYRRFEAAGIPFAFPTQTVHLKTDPEAGPARP